MFPELTDFGFEIRRAFDELERQLGGRSAGEYTPPVDVFDDAKTVTIVVELPGVKTESVRAILKHGVVIVIGEKPQSATREASAQYHVAERSFGRFARAVRIHHAIDGSAARATLAGGELRITIPRLAERRGQQIAIPIEGQR
jgi:HSP20 family protein